MNINTIPVRQVNEKIRAILPAEKAADFIKSNHLITIKLQGGKLKNDIECTLQERFGGPEGVEEMFSIYQQLSQVNAVFTERKRAGGASVSGERSLLAYLTDGESHIKVYPDTPFH